MARGGVVEFKGPHSASPIYPTMVVVSYIIVKRVQLASTDCQSPAVPHVGQWPARASVTGAWAARWHLCNQGAPPQHKNKNSRVLGDDTGELPLLCEVATTQLQTAALRIPRGTDYPLVITTLDMPASKLVCQQHTMYNVISITVPSTC